jgi:4-amino-4-deoxychorismate lyase
MTESRPQCLIDGVASGHVPVDDRGFLYGDLLFETIAFHGNHAPLWALHWQRLARGCELLGLALPDQQQTLAECQSLCPPKEPGIIRLSLSRGTGGRAYFPAAMPVCRRIIQRRAWPADLERQQAVGLKLVVSPIRLAAGSILAGLKHGNRLEQVLAARACQDAGADEAIMLDTEGRVVEAIASNLLIEIDGVVFSPIANSGVFGVGLAWLQQKLGEQIHEAELGIRDLKAASAIMVINSVAGIRPARSLDGSALKPGSRCRQWQQLWNENLS